MTPEGLELLRRGAEETGETLSPQQEGLFARLLDALIQANSQFNLTALKTEPEIVLKHFVDSLTCLRGGSLDGSLKTLDLGTGAGFPSFPLAIVRPELKLYPLDSTGKKINFVRQTAEALELAHITPLLGRAESLGQQADYRGQFDRVVARAVAALPILLELGLPLLKQGGLLVAQKGDLTEQELAAGRHAAAALGGRIAEVESFALPVIGDARTLVVIEKTGPTPAKYPRREGVPNQQPLFWKSK